MNMAYLLSVLDLYLNKERSGNTIVEIKNQNDLVEVSLSYSFDHINKTILKVSKSEFQSRVLELITKMKGDKEIEKEGLVMYGMDKIYNINFLIGRKLSFINFDDSDLKLMGCNLVNVTNNIVSEIVTPKVENVENIVIEDVDEIDNNYEELMNKNKKTRFAFSLGFSSFATLFIIAIWFLDIFMIALWIFKAMR